MIVGDADITLRHLCRRHAEALARPYVTGGPLEIVGWADTQVTAAERRLDKTLLLRVSRRLQALEVEFAYRYERDLPERVHAYQGLSRMAFRAERPGKRPPPMQSVVILLTGRRKRWPWRRGIRSRSRTRPSRSKGRRSPPGCSLPGRRTPRPGGPGGRRHGPRPRPARRGGRGLGSGTGSGDEGFSGRDRIRSARPPSAPSSVCATKVA
jgi:hypothetical protein